MKASAEGNEGAENVFNSKGKGVTEEDLRKCKKFEHLTDEQIKEHLRAIKVIARAMFEIYLQDVKKETEI